MTKTPPSRSQGHRTASMDALVVHLCRCGEPIEFEGDTLCAYCIANTPKAIEPWPEFAALRAGLNHAERGMRVELARLRRTLDRMTDVLHNATAHVRDRSEAEGGAGMGYHLAGIEVTGVDIAKQPRYPFPSERSEGGIECSILLAILMVCACSLEWSAPGLFVMSFASAVRLHGLVTLSRAKATRHGTFKTMCFACFTVGGTWRSFTRTAVISR